MNPSEGESYATAITSAIGFATLVTIQLLRFYSEARSRRWAKEDQVGRNKAAAKKHALLADVVELHALDTLHHAKQPIFDNLIDSFKDPDSMSDQDLTQFLQRLHAIANDPIEQTAQQPNASLILDKALDVAVKRGLRISTPKEAGENLAAGARMRREAEPQRGKEADDGEGPRSKLKTANKRILAELEGKYDRLVEDQSEAGEK